MRALDHFMEAAGEIYTLAVDAPKGPVTAKAFRSNWFESLEGARTAATVHNARRELKIVRGKPIAWIRVWRKTPRGKAHLNDIIFDTTAEDENKAVSFLDSRIAGLQLMSGSKAQEKAAGLEWVMLFLLTGSKDKP